MNFEILDDCLSFLNQCQENTISKSLVEMQPDSRSRGDRLVSAALKINQAVRMDIDNKRVLSWLANSCVDASDCDDALVIPNIAKHEKTKTEGHKNISFDYEFSVNQTNSSDASKEFMRGRESEVKSYKRKTDEKRTYDKRHACFYCKKLVSKCSRHLESVHPHEIDLVQISRKDKKQQAIEFERLRVLGNFNHNVSVLRDKIGVLIVVRRSVRKKDYSDYLPCIYCYGFYEQEQLWRHVQICNQKPEGMDEKASKSIKSQSRMLLEGAGLHSSKACKDDHAELNEIIIKKMRNDEITEVISQDEVILTFGNGLLEKKGKEKRKRTKSVKKCAKSPDYYLRSEKTRKIKKSLSSPVFQINILTKLSMLQGDYV